MIKIIAYFKKQQEGKRKVEYAEHLSKWQYLKKTNLCITEAKFLY